MLRLDKLEHQRETTEFLHVKENHVNGVRQKTFADGLSAGNGADGGGVLSAGRISLAIMLFLFIFTHRGIMGQNDLSRFVAVGSLVNHGVFHIDNSPWTKRMVEEDGTRYHLMNDLAYKEKNDRFYSSKPPVLTIILAGVLKPLQVLGAEFKFIRPHDAMPTFLLTWLVIGSVSAAGFYAFHRVLADYISGNEVAIVTILALGGTLFLTYSTTMNHHTFTATLILIAFFMLGMHKARKRVRPVHAGVGGLLMGLAVTVDCGHGFVFSILFGLYLVFYTHSLPVVLAFGLGAVPPLALHCVVQYSIWGSILPVQMLGATRFEEAYWSYARGPDAWDIARWKYWLLTLFSTRGLFTLSPILLLGISGLAAALRDSWKGLCGSKKPDPGPAYVALTVLAGMLILLVEYSFRANTNFCGACFGFRWYIGFSPLLSWYAARAWVRWRDSKRFRHIFYVLGVISLMYALIGMQEPWLLMENNPHPAVRILLFIRGF